MGDKKRVPYGFNIKTGETYYTSEPSDEEKARHQFWAAAREKARPLHAIVIRRTMGDLGLENIIDNMVGRLEWWYRVGEIFLERRITMAYATLDGRIGQYDPSNRHIGISETMIGSETWQTQACLIVHEGWHALKHTDNPDRERTLADRVEEEIAAIKEELSTWETLRDEGDTRLPFTARAKHLDYLLTIRDQGKLAAYVLTTPGYQKSYFGREIS